jgi:hypothetical protein
MTTKALALTPTVKRAGHDEEIAVLAPVLLREIQALVDAAAALEVVNAEDNENAGMLLSMSTKLEKQVDTQRKEAKEPWAETVKAIDAVAKRALGPLDEVKTQLKRKMGVYFDKVAADNAAKAVFAAPGAVVEQAAVVKSDFTSVRKVLKYAITGAVPADYLMPDEQKIGAAVRAKILTPENAPWLTITEETTVQSTGR